MTIAKFTDDNLSGFYKLELIETKELNDIVFNPDNPDIVDELRFKVLGLFREVFVSRDLGTYTESEEENDQGTFYRQEIVAPHPKDRPSLRIILDKYRDKDVIARITDNNGLVRIVGNLETPLRIVNNHTLGQLSGQANKRVFRIAGQTIKRSAFTTFAEEFTDLKNGLFSVVNYSCNTLNVSAAVPEEPYQFDLINYKFYRSTNGSTFMLVQELLSSVYGEDVSALPAGTSLYYYAVTDADGLIFRSATYEVRIMHVPVITSIELVGTTVRMNINYTYVWPSDEIFFELHRSEDNITFEEIERNGFDNLVIEDNSAIPGNTYYYKVRAVRSLNGHRSCFSEVVEFNFVPAFSFETEAINDFSPSLTQTGNTAIWLFENNYSIASDNPKVDNNTLEADAGLDGNSQRVNVFVDFAQLNQINLRGCSITQLGMELLLTAVNNNLTSPDGLIIDLLENAKPNNTIMNLVTQLQAKNITVLIADFKADFNIIS